MALACSLSCALAHAQAPIVNDADIERARRSQPTVSDADIRRAQERNRMPTDVDLHRMAAPSTPRIGALPRPTERTPMDLSALASGFNAEVGQQALAASRPGPQLLVFVSFTVPYATLTRLADQASRANATLVLRGLVDSSLSQTVTRTRQLIGNRHLEVQIDPRAFDRYAITLVPSFVLVRDGTQAWPCSAGACMPGNGFVAVAGDVSLDYALDFLGRSAPSFAADADAFVRRLRAAPK